MASRRGAKKARDRRGRIHAFAKAMKKRCRCGKVHAASRHEAQEKFLLACQRHHRRDRVRFYACEFGGWHWTRERPLTTSAATSTAAVTAAVEEVPPRRPQAHLTPEQQAWIDELAAAARPT